MQASAAVRNVFTTVNIKAPITRLDDDFTPLTTQSQDVRRPDLNRILGHQARLTPATGTRLRAEILAQSVLRTSRLKYITREGRLLKRQAALYRDVSLLLAASTGIQTRDRTDFPGHAHITSGDRACGKIASKMVAGTEQRPPPA